MKLRSLPRRSVLAAPALAATVMLPGGRTARAQLPMPQFKAEPASMVMPGNITFRAKLFVPQKTPAPALVVVPDGWGLTPEFEVLGANLAYEGMLGLVIDLNGGKLATSQAEADQLAKQVNSEQAADVISAWYDWLRNRPEATQRVGALGFGPGGKWAVQGSYHKAANGVAVWCTRIDGSPNDLHSIYELFIGHYSDKDSVPGPVMVAEMTQKLKAARREGTFWRYSSKPGFYNPRSPDYDKPDASIAWRRTIAAYKKLFNLPPAS